MTATQRPATYREVFAEPSFRALFAAQSLAVGAVSLQIYALSVLVYAATGSPLLSAVAFGAGFLPQFVGGLLLGSLPDRLPPRPLIVAGYLVEMTLAGVLALADLPVATSLALVALVAVGTPVFAGSALRVIADRLTGDAYVLGRSVSTMSSSAAQLLGLAAGGVAVAALGPRNALLVAAAGHLLAAVTVRFGLPAEAVTGARRGSAVRDSLTGARGLLTDRVLRRLLLAQWLPLCFVVGAEALLVSYAASRGFASGAGALLMAAPPAGMLLGNAVAGRLLRPAVRERHTGTLLFLLGAPLLGLAATPPLVVTAGLLVLSGAGFAYEVGLQRRFLAAAPDDRRGQVFALLATGVMVFQGTGPLLVGAAAQVTTPAVAIAAAGLATLLVAPFLRRIDRPRRRGGSGVRAG
ncbi:MFS transporter [Asanoa siamensis]|uniref:MFS transporter n=1 Tax=Asanoa siamensis TaxID=926357 RepID=A0ABQ4D490_9ACTN|nr:MFS transporter [Asanoa siamensis]GIF78359.1 MFS transporter [Asanoa siamensis]